MKKKLILACLTLVVIDLVLVLLMTTKPEIEPQCLVLLPLVNFAFVILIIVLFVAFYFRPLPPVSITPEGLMQGVKIPLKAAQGSLKWLYRIRTYRIPAFSHNSMNPYLKLFNDHIEYRVVFKGKSRLDNIESVDICDLLLTSNMVILFKDTGWIFVANFYKDTENRLKVLDFFKQNNVPLSVAAQDLLTTGEPKSS